MKNGTCSIAGCEGPLLRQGWCSKHYWRWYRHGDPMHPVNPLFRDPRQALAARTKRVGECLEWTGDTSDSGYGNMRFEGRMRRAHTVAFILEHGPVPEGYELDHKCHNTLCVNTRHLRLATPKQNSENKAGPYRNSRSGVRGVYWHKASSKWAVKVTHHWTPHHGGLFATIEEAEAAAIALRNQLFTHNDLDRK